MLRPKCLDLLSVAIHHSSSLRPKLLDGKPEGETSVLSTKRGTGLRPPLTHLLLPAVVRRLLGLVADLANLAKHVAEVHSGERLEQCRRLRSHLRQVPGDLVQS